MRLRSFHANSIPEAMRLVRSTMGDDAIIVATREEEGGGVRVTAALDDSLPTATEAPTPSAASAPAADTGPQAVEVIENALYRHGTPAALAENIITAATQHLSHDPLLTLAAALDQVIPFAPLTENKKPILLIGPPGSGKTLTAAKIAMQAQNLRKSIAVFSTDNLRAAGMAELRAITRLLALDLVEIEDIGALKDAIDVNKQSQIIIDSGGRNPFDMNDMRELATLIKASGAEPVLVLPAGLDAAEAADAGRAFAALGTKRLLLTRLDLVRRLGSALGVVSAAKLHLAGICASPRVADGLEALDPVALARRILPDDTSSHSHSSPADTPRAEPRRTTA